MQEDTPNNGTEKKDIIDMAMKKVQSAEDSASDNGKANNSALEDALADNGANGEEDINDLIDRRKYPRSEFTYPVEFRVFSRSSDNPSIKSPEQSSINGYLKDISLCGACLQFEDRYGRFITNMNNMKLKISFSIPDGDKVNIFAEIKWMKKVNPKNFSIKIGIEFKDLEGWQINIIEKLISMRNKDHNMIWNLWEQYETKR